MSYLNLMRALKISPSLALAIGGCVIVGGCGTIVPGTPWSQESYEGPLLIGDQHAKAFKRCSVAPPMMGRGHCELAFLDHQGEKVLWTDVQEQTDSYLKTIPALAPWVGELRSDGTGVSMPSRRERPYRVPYKLHILTISPIVVLAVPRSEGDLDSCGVPSLDGCIPSPRTGSAFYYQDNIKVVRGSFVFSPDSPLQVLAIPNDTEHFEIGLQDSYLALIAEKGTWRVRRNGRSN